MEILCIIPARGGSKGIKNKNLVKLAHKPLLHYTISSALDSNVTMKIIVSSDNDKIISFAKKYKIQYIKRPKNLSNSKTSLEPVMNHTLKYLNKHENYKPDVIILLQNTSPLRTAYHVRSALRFFKSRKFDSVLSGFKSHYFLWEEKKQLAIPKNYDPKNRPNRQSMKTQFVENGAIYITKYSSFLKSNCRISGKIGMYEMKESESIDIDTKFDLFFAEKLIKTI